MLNEYNQTQEKISNSFSQAVEIIKRKSVVDENDELLLENESCSKKIKTDESSNIISKHAKYFK